MCLALANRRQSQDVYNSSPWHCFKVGHSNCTVAMKKYLLRWTHSTFFYSLNFQFWRHSIYTFIIFFFRVPSCHSKTCSLQEYVPSTGRNISYNRAIKLVELLWNDKVEEMFYLFFSNNTIPFSHVQSCSRALQKILWVCVFVNVVIHIFCCCVGFAFGIVEPFSSRFFLVGSFSCGLWLR